MKSLISEIIKIELSCKLLSESRIQDTKTKFPQDIDIVDYFVSQDPSGNNKYLNWAMKVYKQLPPNAPAELKEKHKELIANHIKSFHQHSSKLEIRDINKYKSLADLNTVLSPLIKTSEKAVEKLKQENDSLKLYEDADWLMIVPLTHETSCKYGANTKWCVASRKTKKHFKSYTKSGSLIYLIHKKSNNKFAFYYEYNNNTVEIYNPNDTDISNKNGIDGSVENFLQGLIDGKMEEYLVKDENDENCYRTIWINRNGKEKNALTCGEKYLLNDLIDIVLEYLLGYGSGRNTLKKYKDVFTMFGITLELHDKKEDSTFSLKDNTGELVNSKNWIVINETDKYFISRAKDGWCNQYLNSYLNENLTPDEIIDVAKNNGMNIKVIGIGYDKLSDLTNVMSKRQALLIYKAYNDYVSKTNEEHNNRVDKMVNEVLDSVINIKEFQKFEVCYNPDKIFDVLDSLFNLKRIVIKNLRNAGVIRGRLPKNWPSTPKQKQQFLFEFSKKYFLNYCIMEVNDGKHPINIPIIRKIKNGKKIKTDISSLYSQLYDNGFNMNGYNGLIKLLIDRSKK